MAERSRGMKDSGWECGRIEGADETRRAHRRSASGSEYRNRMEKGGEGGLILCLPIGRKSSLDRARARRARWADERSFSRNDENVRTLFFSTGSAAPAAVRSQVGVAAFRWSPDPAERKIPGRIADWPMRMPAAGSCCFWLFWLSRAASALRHLLAQASRRPLRTDNRVLTGLRRECLSPALR